jgi:hypothetical protein
MSRMHLPYVASDISELARRMRAELRDSTRSPSHVEMLNMLARAVGFRNFQHFRADTAARARLEAPPEPAPQIDHAALERLARNFDDRGRLARWPSKQSQQLPCIWVMWSRIPPRVVFTEREISELLASEHTFGDHALLRRELVNYKLVDRPIDGSAYQRVERGPPPEIATLIRVLRERSARAGLAPGRAQ